MRRYDHMHAIFEDGHEVEIGFTGYPQSIEDSDDARRTFCENMVRLWTVDEEDPSTHKYRDMPIKKIWLAG